MIEAGVCVHDDASFRLVWSRGQRPPFLLLGSSLFQVSALVSLLLFAVLRFLFLFDCLTPVQPKLSSCLSSQASSLRFMSRQVCSVLPAISPACVCVCVFVVFIQLQIKVLWDNAAFTVCLWLVAALYGEWVQRNKVWVRSNEEFHMLFTSRADMNKRIWDGLDSLLLLLLLFGGAADWPETWTNSIQCRWRSQRTEPKWESPSSLCLRRRGMYGGTAERSHQSPPAVSVSARSPTRSGNSRTITDYVK